MKKPLKERKPQKGKVFKPSNDLIMKKKGKFEHPLVRSYHSLKWNIQEINLNYITNINKRLVKDKLNQ